MSNNRTIRTEPITVYIEGRPRPATLYTSYKGALFLKKISRWAEVLAPTTKQKGRDEAD